ncbi:sulfatase [Rhabdobacter roseus]|uniref:Arylsulfatase A-like enzyme n=1 Tax=Rhabdobacter roseus TaxID=1655419 RepID=A0A840TWW2_9BACT|nr:sulfatase-like hydrolase/transferase [Rhabdobacter roseus]MBB5285753.1 arylsulfatase A-like enzyme [Rhabdobacter roseus]
MNSKYLFGLLGFVWLLLSGVHAQAQQRPNIVWIVSEDNSPLLGCYGDAFATTPHLDQLAAEGVRYTKAYATAPVCAPARSTLITGVYPTSLGTLNMRSTYPLPTEIAFFPKYLRQAGYYTTNNAKKDYNTEDQPDAWDESSKTATYKNRKPGQPFFAVFNIEISHESSLHEPLPALRHDPEQVPIPPYHPRTSAMKHDWAQYYDKVEMMDRRVGEILAELRESGLAENTIVFYYSDHGGVLGRSKRFLYESGLHVPLIIRFPEPYAALAPGGPGSTQDRLVTFADFAPTILSLAQVPIPAYMQGRAFLGAQTTPPARYAFGFRGRMDERFDLSRTVTDGRYRYVRHYMPHKIYGQYLEYLWRAPSMASWEEAYRRGELNEVQARFWQSKPVEELYDIAADPHNVHNLAADPKYQATLKNLREANRQWLLTSRDAGFIPEPRMVELAAQVPLYTFARSDKYPLDRVLRMAELASEGQEKNQAALKKGLQDSDPTVRYWAALGCTILGSKAAPLKGTLLKQLDDPDLSVRLAAAEAAYRLGEKQKPLEVLSAALQTDNLMARVLALNILDDMGEEARPALALVQALVPAVLSPNRDYDVRSAESLVQKLKP